MISFWLVYFLDISDFFLFQPYFFLQIFSPLICQIGQHTHIFVPLILSKSKQIPIFLLFSSLNVGPDHKRIIFITKLDITGQEWVKNEHIVIK